MSHGNSHFAIPRPEDFLASRNRKPSVDVKGRAQTRLSACNVVQFTRPCRKSATITNSDSMQFRREITIGDVITAASVLVAVVSFVFSQWQDRVQARSFASAQVRVGAGEALSELSRIDREVQLFFLKIEPEYVTISSELGIHKDVLLARDALWQKMSSARATMEDSIESVSPRGAQFNLAVRHRDTYVRLQKTYRLLGDLRTATAARLIEEAQAEILPFENKLADYNSAILGNALRNSHSKIVMTYKDVYAEIVEGVVPQLESILASQD